MFGLKSKIDGFRLRLPDEFIPEQINDKYAKILQDKHGFYYKPIDFLNETIQKVQVLGFNNGTVLQKQVRRGEPTFDENKRVEQNKFMHAASDFVYRSPDNPLNLFDKVLNVDFRYTLGFLNYFILFESFFYQYSRDMKYTKFPEYFNVEIMNERGAIYSKIVLMNPIIDGIDMLDLDYTQPIAASKTFRVVWKYSNLDFQFLES